MTEAAKTVLTAYEVRKTKGQKEAFRAFLCRELGKLGYEPRVESGRSLVTSHNVVAGDPERPGSFSPPTTTPVPFSPSPTSSPPGTFPYSSSTSWRWRQ